MSVNKVILIGNLGKDPDVQYISEGVPVASFPLATTKKGFTARSGQEVPTRTEWHNIVMWRGLAETAEKHLHKGDRVYIEGELRTRSYEDRNGILRYVTEIYAETMEMLGSPQKRPLPPDPMAPADTARRPETAQAGPVPQQASMFDPSEDDLPF